MLRCIEMCSAESYTADHYMRQDRSQAQVLCTLMYRRRSLYSFLLDHVQVWCPQTFLPGYADGLAQDCSNAIGNAPEPPQTWPMISRCSTHIVLEVDLRPMWLSIDTRQACPTAQLQTQTRETEISCELNSVFHCHAAVMALWHD